ncbi:MAG: hypothetical protein ACR2LL_10870 [Nitrosopumilus sp.]|uniref:hypothetical protein n=1 Tax=Nitrosopumilus sp. TaxID=2024843 RepID=UPI00292E2822|nr:hypothetical protein [Nitrosopumilus sp.]
MSEIVIEKLLEQRDLYLNTLKHLEFELLMEPTEKEIDRIKELQKTTVDQLKEIEQELAHISNKRPS